MRDSIVEKDRMRYRLLRKVFEAANGSRCTDVGIVDLIAQEGQAHDAAEDALLYLIDEGLLEERSYGSVNLTHRGIVEVEQSREQPARPTPHFTLAVIQHFHGTVGAVQNASNSTAHVVQNIGLDVRVVLDLVSELRSNLPALPPSARQEAGDLVEGLASEARAASPNVTRMRAFANMLAPIMKKAGTAALQEVVKRLVAAIPAHIA